MKNAFCPVTYLSFLLFALAAVPAPAQAPPSGLAGLIVEARQKNNALTRKYSWECRTDVDGWHEQGPAN